MNPTWRPAVMAPWLALCAVARAQEPAPATPVFPAQVEAVTVDVVVLGKDGQPVRGLGCADFVLREDGTPQTVESCRAVDLAAPAPEPLPVVSPSLATNADALPAAGRTVFVLFDDLHMLPPAAERAKKALAGFLDAQRHDGDHVTLLATSGGTRTSARLPGGRASLQEWVAQQQGRRPPIDPRSRITEHEAYRITALSDRQLLGEIVRRYIELGLIYTDLETRDTMESRPQLDMPVGANTVRSAALEVYSRGRTQTRGVLQRLQKLLEALAVGEGRKTVLLVSEGFFLDPSERSFDEVKQSAARANAAVYFLDLRGAGATADGTPIEIEHPIAFGHIDTSSLHQEDRAAEGSESLALDTGGLVMRGPAADSLAQVARESEVYYLLGYTPSNSAADGRFRKIEVEVKRPGLEVRARRGYQAAAAAKKAPVAGTAPELALALDSPLESAAVPLQLAAYVLGPSDGGRVTVLLAGAADGARLAWAPKGDRFEDVLEARFRVAPLAGGEPTDRERRLELSLTPEARDAAARSGVAMLRDFDLLPGRYAARLAVLDANAGRVGSVFHGFEVPEPGFRLSTPILTDVIQAVAAGEPPRPVPLARRTFDTGRKLYCGFQVHGAAPGPGGGAPKVSTEMAVLRADGQPLASSPVQELPPGPEGELSRLLAVSLERAAPGEYQLVLRARDNVSGRTDERRESFQVRGVGGAAAASAAPPAPGPGYAELLAGYRRGEVAAAVSGLRALGGPGSHARALRRDCDAACLKAAAVMHTEAALAPGARRGDQASQIATARELLERLPEGPESKRLLRDWLLVVGYHYEGESRFADALRMFDEAARVSPSDAEVLLAQGTVAEVLAVLPGLQPPTQHDAAPVGSASLTKFVEGAEGDRLERQALELYERALALDAGLLEARLRRGWLLQRRAKLREARPEIEAVARDAQAPHLRALAQLFLAGLDEREGRGDAAIEKYRAALAAQPGFQAAGVGLAHALQRAGKSRAAAEVIETLLQNPVPDDEDPWVGYHLGLGWRRDAALQALRARVTS